MAENITVTENTLCRLERWTNDLCSASVVSSINLRIPIRTKKMAPDWERVWDTLG